MRRSSLWLELPLILLVLLFLEVGAILRELRTDVVIDWFVSIAPLIWINASLLVLYAFVRVYRNPDVASPIPGRAMHRTTVFFVPNLGVLRPDGDGSRRVWAVAAIAYGLAFMFLQGMLVVDPSGSIQPVSTVLDSPVGYGPGFVWAPTTTFGVVIRPFSLATAVVLSLLSGAVVALSVRLFAATRKAATALPSPLLGFAVACPACLGAPVSGLFLAYAAPLAPMGAMGAASAFSRMLVLSTAVLIATLLLLWIVVSFLTNLNAGRSSAPT